ncbi:MAG: hypothetical protein CMO06_10460 [Thalassospira sp.]|uniref:hypothetical protein n=1 Tax=Thalassospira sp. TaxID=1912094 RepID=UPI000C5ED655|nr:hypothetical protein [Thalassospira sp.]MAZ31974.1 hypothetical protein [Thalassospira sp.]MAZ33554.1 hypothetical protein [Thalassospira sp.]|tara:strand:+ start:580 stop:1050 length:471 start_codon:yes stop_codon:yes gene_type:complete
MAYAQEIRLDDLPDDVDGHVSQLLALWQDACRGGDIPDRGELSCEVLSAWRDDIGIYEYQPDRNDFLIRIDAPNMIAASGENYQGSTPRQIDLDFGTAVYPTLCEVVRTGQAQIHMIGVERIEWENWLRLMLPVRTRCRKGTPVIQVLVVHFLYKV